MKTDWSRRRVTILGAARQGQAAARWLVRHGAQVTINDRRTADQMTAAQAALAGLDLTWVLGGHPTEILDSTDIVCLSGGVPLDNPIVAEANRRAIPLTNDSQVFMEICPCPTIGITGSAGKTTTTMLVGLMAKAVHPGKVFTGGNIGDPLLNHVDDMESTDLAILEISSFQLEQMTISPATAVILNITPNHLDRHGSMAVYTAAKQMILDHQDANDTAVLGREDRGAWDLRGKVHGKLTSFGFSPLPEGMNGTFMENGTLFLKKGNQVVPLLRRGQIQLRGDHNVMNVLAAYAILDAAGLPVDSLESTVSGFNGAAHRLEFVRELHGVKWYNDSIATAPERSMAAIRSFTDPIVLLLGGRDKNLPWEDLTALAERRVEGVVLFGEAAPIIAAAFQKKAVSLADRVVRCSTLHEAVNTAARLVKPGQVVLFSPGGTSFDEFNDFEARGEAFRKWVSELL